MRRIFSADKTTLYEYPDRGPAKVLVCSTASSRRLLIDPVISGLGYRSLVRAAVTEALEAMAQTEAAGLPVLRTGLVSVLNILRGGLSFGVEDAIAEVFAVDPLVSFIGTSRSVDKPVEITYTRWELGAAEVLAIGDIVATAGTLTSALSSVISEVAQRRSPLRSILLFTIGAQTGVERVQDFLAGLPKAERPEATIVAFESLYALPTPGTQAPFGRYPFDLLRSPASSAPEYEIERLQTLGSLFERCAVYDGGVRAFTPPQHVEMRRSWWDEVVGRRVPLTDLADLTAGLAPYRLSPQEWKRAMPWASDQGVDFGRIHDLGRKALRYAQQTQIAEYVSTTLMNTENREEQ